jgi:hypothetical protein
LARVLHSSQDVIAASRALDEEPVTSDELDP